MTDRYENLRALYQAARPDEEPSRADLRAVRTAMMSAGIAAATFHVSGAAGKLLALAPGGAKLFTLSQAVKYAAIGVAIGGGVATVGVAIRHNAAAHATVAVAAPKPPPLAKSNARLAPSPEPMQPEPSERANLPAASSAEASPTAIPARSNQEPPSAPIATAEPLETSAPPVPSAPERAAPSRALSLLDESRGLAEVQVALGSGNVSRALQLLDLQDQAFRGGSLTQERAAARVIALCASHRADAELAKEHFVNAYPGSPLVRRVTAACKGQ